MPEKLKLGIFGAARNVPFSVIDPVNKNPDLAALVELSGIACLTKEEAEEAAKKWNIPKVYNSYEEMLADPAIDAVYNSLPIKVRCNWSVKALQSGKHVLSETPVGCNAREAVVLQRCAEDKGRVLQEGTHPTCHPVTKRVREMILNNAIGKVERIELDLPITHGLHGKLTCAKIGANMSLGVHAGAILRTLAVEEPRVISATATRSKDDPEIDTEMRVEFITPNGCKARVHLSVAEESLKMPTYFTITGSTGVIRSQEWFHKHGPSSNEIQLEQFEGQGDTWVEIVNNKVQRDTFYFQLKTFSEEVQEQRSRQMDEKTKDNLQGMPWHYTKGAGPVDAVRNIALIDCIYRSSGMKPRTSEIELPAPYNAIGASKL